MGWGGVVGSYPLLSQDPTQVEVEVELRLRLSWAVTTKHPSPFIYLKGIKRTELDYVIFFLYNGKANVVQDELNNFLENYR